MAKEILPFSPAKADNMNDAEYASYGQALLYLWHGKRPVIFDERNLPPEWVVRGTVGPRLLQRMLEQTGKIDFIPVMPTRRNKAAHRLQKRLQSQFEDMIFVVIIDDEFAPNGDIEPVLMTDLLHGDVTTLVNEFVALTSRSEEEEDPDLYIVSQMKLRASMLLAGLRDGH